MPFCGLYLEHIVIILFSDQPIVSAVDNDKRTCLHAAACGG